MAMSKGKGKNKVKTEPGTEADRGLERLMLSDAERRTVAGLLGLKSTDAAEVAEVATAPTTMCTSHVGSDTDPWTCRKCGKPFGQVAKELAEQWRLRDRPDEWEERIDAARQSEARDDETPVDALGTPGPYKDGLGHILVAITPLWHERAVKLAEGVPMTDYVEGLIKRQWIASGAGKGQR